MLPWETVRFIKSSACEPYKRDTTRAFERKTGEVVGGICAYLQYVDDAATGQGKSEMLVDVSLPCI